MHAPQEKDISIMLRPILLASLLAVCFVLPPTMGQASAQGSDTGPGNPTLLQALQTLQQSVNALQTSVNTLQTTVNGIQTLQTTVNALQTSVNNLQTSTNSVLSSVSALQTSLTTLQTTVAHLPTDPRKKYYLTKGAVPGNGPRTACDTGFHLAALWEILTPATLKYDTGRGQVVGDSGAGPVAGGALGPFAWVRTGAPAATINEAGTGNCNGWTSASASDHGTTVNLQGIWDYSVFVSQIAPWVSDTPTCDQQNPVWCMED